jgi:OCRE domain
MGYKILNFDQSLRLRYQERDGLEGPFFYECGTVLYYDPREGKYWDPKTDFYLEHDESNRIVNPNHYRILDILKRAS